MERSIGAAVQQLDDRSSASVILEEGIEEIRVLDRSEMSTRRRLDRQSLADVRHSVTIIPLPNVVGVREWVHVVARRSRRPGSHP